MDIRNNEAAMSQIDKVAEVAGYLWEKGWAERNGGNISLNITEFFDVSELTTDALTHTIMLEEPVEALAGELFYVTGTSKRMRYVAKSPFDNGSVIRVNQDGTGYDIVAEKPIMPTSELPSHLAMHNFLKAIGVNNKVVLHTHPTDVIALSHCIPFLDSQYITRVLWSMIPECRVIVPRGLGIVPYNLPGSMKLAKATIELLDRYDVVLWEKHGILAVGDDIIECFDAIDTLSKSAQIYLYACQAGFAPQGMSNGQLDELVPAFNLPNQG